MDIAFVKCILLVSIGFISQVEGAGKVVIGYTAADLSSSGATNPSVYVFTPNDTPFIPIYIIEDGGATITDTVNVTCQIDSTQSTALPFTNANFGFSDTLSAANTKSNISLTILQRGRAVNFYCYGVSLGSGTQFKELTSRSATRALRGDEAPTVSICESRIMISDLSSPPVANLLNIKLSEIPVSYNLTVKCSIVSTTTSASMTVTIPDTIILVQSAATSHTLQFDVTAYGTDVTIGCTAESDSPGTQFKTATSQGSTAVLYKQSSTVEFVPSRVQTTASVFQLALVLDTPIDPTSQPVSFVCAVVAVTSDEEQTAAVANRQCDTAAVNVTANTTTVLNGTWGVDNNGRLNYQRNEIAKILTVSRSAVPTVAGVERLVVTCCGPVSQSEPTYRNKTAAAFVTISYPSLVPVNTSATPSTSETALQNPAFVNPAPCPCNLQPNQCDPGCCCDSKCTDADKNLTTCLTGYFGGVQTSVSRDSCASASNPGQEDYSQFMCIMYENNAVIGSYYTPTPKALKDSQAVVNKIKATTTPYTLTIGTSRVPTDSNAASSGYSQGDAILMNNGNDAFSSGLTLPGTSSSGCDADALVRYLEDRTSRCPVTLTTSCNAATLNARNYALSTSLRQPACPAYPKIRAGRGLTDVPTTTNYYCVENAATLLGTYLSGPAASAPDPTATGLPTISCQTFDNITYTCNATSLGPGPGRPTVVAKRCSFDDGESLPTAPSYDSTNKLCKNIVIGASYSFAWNGSVLRQLNAEYLLADINPVDTSGNNRQLTQQFKVNFTYGNLPTNLSTVPVKRAGVFGYDEQSTIIGGLLNETAGTVDRSTSYQPFMLVPGTDGLCSTAGKESIVFPMATQTMCQIYLKLQNFNDCPLLRQEMKAYVDLLTPYNVLATYGDPSDTTAADWAPVVIRPSDLTSTNNTSSLTPPTASNTTSNSTTNVTGIILGTLLEHRCDNIPTGIVMSVIYAKQGEARDIPIHQIIGVEKRYVLSGMTITCDSSPNSPCVDTNRGKAFNIYLSYRFVYGPKEWKTDVYASTTTGVTICWWDICSNDILGLWLSTRYASIRSEVMGYSLILLFVSIPTLYFSWPW